MTDPTCLERQSASFRSDIGLYFCGERIKSKNHKLLPVKTTTDIPNEKLSEAMQTINRLQLSAPIKLGDVIVKDFIEKGNNLVATKTIIE